MSEFIFSKRGSITLEAVVVFPFFLALLLLLINLINVCAVYISMEHAVNETTKQLAAHAFPLQLLDPVKPVGVEALTDRVLTDPSAISESFPQELKGALVTEVTTLFGNQIKEVTAGRLEPLVKYYAQGKIREFFPGQIGEQSFEINKAIMYNPLNNTGSNCTLQGHKLNNEDIAIAVEYKVRLPVPFFLQEVKLANIAVERAWIDDK